MSLCQYLPVLGTASSMTGSGRGGCRGALERAVPRVQDRVFQVLGHWSPWELRNWELGLESGTFIWYWNGKDPGCEQ